MTYCGLLHSSFKSVILWLYCWNMICQWEKFTIFIAKRVTELRLKPAEFWRQSLVWNRTLVWWREADCVCQWCVNTGWTMILDIKGLPSQFCCHCTSNHMCFMCLVLVLLSVLNYLYMFCVCRLERLQKFVSNATKFSKDKYFSLILLFLIHQFSTSV